MFSDEHQLMGRQAFGSFVSSHNPLHTHTPCLASLLSTRSRPQSSSRASSSPSPTPLSMLLATASLVRTQFEFTFFYFSDPGESRLFPNFELAPAVRIIHLQRTQDGTILRLVDHPTSFIHALLLWTSKPGTVVTLSLCRKAWISDLHPDEKPSVHSGDLKAWRQREPSTFHQRLFELGHQLSLDTLLSTLWTSVL